MEYQQIAETLGVHRGTLFHWMSGNRSPSKTSMLKIEEKLGWPVDEQMAAFNTLTGEVGPNGKPRDSYGAELRAFLENRYNTPEAAPGRVGSRA